MTGQRYSKLYISILILLLQTFLVVRPCDVSAVRPDPFLPEKAGFSVRLKHEVSPYKVIGLFLLPGETITLEIEASDKHDLYELNASCGEVIPLEGNKWTYRVPLEPGLYPAIVSRADSDLSMTLNVFVMIPFHQLKGKYLNGYRIGRYPTIPYKNLPIYNPPRGFIEVTAENENTLVAPHFRLKQFLCKQESGYPKYLVLKIRLLLKLELILEHTNEKGFRADTFTIMSGYRTPYYNKAIGNVKYSRHVYGGASDIFIDEHPKDDMMDDLNGDGMSDVRDAAILYDIVDEMYGRSWYTPFVGGLGRYRKTAAHGPFVHVDVRGFRARWGT